MSLRSDSVYRVDISKSSPSQDDSERKNGSPPKVLQIRLTEPALRQLAAACSSTEGGLGSIRIDVDPTDPLLVIGDAEFPLHAPLPAGGSQASRASSQREVASTSSAPHELYKLSKDESTLHGLGTISTKFTVKPTRDVSAVAQRLKQQKEEEEHRKEERRRALMQGTSPHSSNPAASSRSGVSKTLSGVRASSGSPSLVASPLSRSSSLNRIPGRRETNLFPPSSLSRDVSRERPNAGSSLADRERQIGASYSAALARRSDRAVTASPQISGTSRRQNNPVNIEEDGQLPSDEDRSERTRQLSSPASAASDAASKKTPKLTTRQRLAKATKAGSRLLAASERHATPERRTTPAANHISPPSQRGSLNNTPKANSSGSSTETPAWSPTRSRAEEKISSVSPRREALDKSTVHDSTGQDRGRKTSSALTSAATTVRDKPLLVSESSSASFNARNLDGHERKSASSATNPRSAAASLTGTTSTDSNKAIRPTALVEDGRSSTPNSKTMADSREPRTTMKSASSSAVQVVTMKKARPSNISDSNTTASRVFTSSTPSKRPQPEPSPDRPEWADRPALEHRSNDHSLKNTSSPSPSKPTSTRELQDGSSDLLPRKRRRTDDFTSSDSASRHRERRSSTSSSANNGHANESPSLRESGQEDTGSGPALPRANIPVSASMPSFAPTSNKLHTVAEHRETRLHGGEYRDRRRERAYDEWQDEEDKDRDSGRRSLEAASQASTSTPSSKSHPERPIRGVGPGATHWSEPWLDVRSKSDWHRLAQRFAKTQEEYLMVRHRLEVESERLDREMQLVEKEEQSTRDGAAAEQSLLFSPHQISVVDADGEDVVMGEVDKETAINTSMNARGHGKVKVEDGDESPEEGEMVSDDEGAVGTRERASVNAASSLDGSSAGQQGRSESPDGLAWRSGSMVKSGGGGEDRPLTYADLAERVKEVGEMHGSLSRMHRVLVEFKGKTDAVR
ncbi:hypothetical protein PHSY_005397 [Pseudozyma hubeiensis SY62]|uniref:Uncharacterized protein n=1 Tax=Pseudozyma hubeiensis (strain SY62) TaxID=1305764 RepID=R9P8Y5_PSEHS|nr:hypothetical protein PHSY_005397 [Pseudozyma hubeiensis SY62]GAC97809.1 hypothetical protein PHSY_005397 [Pseudozyma hubeiensis SY62]